MTDATSWAGLWICRDCGTLHDSADDECCGNQVSSLEDALSYQGALFEATGDEMAQSVLETLKDVYTDALTAERKAESKLILAKAGREAAQQVLVDFFALTA